LLHCGVDIRHSRRAPLAVCFRFFRTDILRIEARTLGGAKTDFLRRPYPSRSDSTLRALAAHATALAAIHMTNVGCVVAFSVGT